MTKVVHYLLTGCAVAAAVLLTRAAMRHDDVAVTFEPKVTQLEKLGQLVTTKIHVADVLTSIQEDYKGSWLVKGDALIAVDLTKAQFLEKSMERRHAVLQLPAPQIIQARVDHSRTKTWSVEKTSWVPGWVPFVGAKGDPDEMRDLAMAKAQRLIEYAAHSSESLNRSRETATQLITNMYRLVDWEVEIRWQDGETPSAAEPTDK